MVSPVGIRTTFFIDKFVQPFSLSDWFIVVLPLGPSASSVDPGFQCVQCLLWVPVCSVFTLDSSVFSVHHVPQYVQC